MNRCARVRSASSAYHVHHASVCENVVIGVLVVLCELHVIVRVHVISLVVHAVVGLTLGLIAHVVIVVFVVAILQRIFCIWRFSLYISVDMRHTDGHGERLLRHPGSFRAHCGVPTSLVLPVICD